jgi:arylsulfatase A-like enzyme
MLEIIDSQDSNDPLLLFYAPHIAHCPLQVPKEYLQQFDFITATDDGDRCRVETANVYPENDQQPVRISCRKQYRAMVHLLDDMIGKVVDRLVKRNMWDNLLIVFTSDNGGPVRLEESGATNYPLRGGKYSPWEGGVRAAAFVSGGYLPANRRGIKIMEPIHIADWYRTLAALAGNEHVDDELARLSGLPPLDSINMAPLLLGNVTTSPRVEIPLSPEALIVGDFKLIWKERVEWAGWSGPQYPHANSTRADIQDKTLNCKDGCLFDVVRDPGECRDLAQHDKIRLATMKERLVEHRKTFFENNDRGVDSCPSGIGIPCACWAAVNYYGGFFGPYQEVDEMVLVAKAHE